MTAVWKRGEIEQVLPSIDMIGAMEKAFTAYSRGDAVVPPVGELLFVSGQLPIMPDGKLSLGSSVREQFRQCINNVFAILRAAGSAPDLVVGVTVYVSDISFWAEFNEEYEAIFGSAKPARTIVPCNALHDGFDIEIDAIAMV